ncbi:hypothetical protein DA69_11605 [Brevundimonas naejangsanensis]|uniref:DUF418 domain-containing protein n=1 Tax=Brevundimonas naejangsanensis TaxID=588932 RepID=A0A172Y852_9CAUL|nr:DUF418 domain-containing protein [Brevundimonas naejangsanensis]ANF55332.1 hypothetical protein DA69_11605 [Brevundimonas naejangsanensis]
MRDQVAAAPPTPVAAVHRIVTLDVLRGAAVLGILAVNAAAFALPMLAIEMSSGPSPFPAEANASGVAQWIIAVFFQQKFVTLFSMLFGVSIFLVGGERGDEAKERVLRRRLLFLALFGLIHGAAFWYGDILLLYAWSGLFVMTMRSMPAGRLIWIGAGVTVVLGTLQAGLMLLMANFPEAMSSEASDGTVAASIAAYQSGWAGAALENLKTWAIAQGMNLLMYVFSTVPLMMLGLGLFKAGFFHGRMSMRVYVSLMAGGAVVLALLAGLEWMEIQAGAEVEATGGWAMAVGSYPLIITLGYASALILATTRGVGWLRKALAPVGRMAFTNYLTQTLIMATIFYMPWGPRLFGQVDYPMQWAIVVGVWALQLIWSPLWLSKFTMGPFEWLWRRLSYGRDLPLRRTA